MPPSDSGVSGAAVSDSNATGRLRVEAIDLLRGFVVALMVLDHVREYFSAAAFQFDPVDVSQTTPALFATRWVTHLCAPTFVFLAGASVSFLRINGMDPTALGKRLVTRGLWLLLLEVTLIGFAFNFAEPFLFLQVIWAIGLGMVGLAALVTLPGWAIAMLGAGLVIATPAATAALASVLAPGLLHVLLAPGPLAPLPGVVAYPAAPWFGILALGYAAGPLLATGPATLRRRAAAGGLALLAAFVALRLVGIGDPRGFGAGPTPMLRALAFFNVSKYPPSLQFTTLTLGVSALLLALLTHVRRGRTPMLEAFGKAPFFTYVLHILLIHTAQLVAGLATGFPASMFTHFVEGGTGLRHAHWGFGLPAVYAIWVAVLLALRPAAIRFARVKTRGGRWWLSYL